MDLLTFTVCVGVVPLVVYLAVNLLAATAPKPARGVYVIKGRWHGLKYYLAKVLLSIDRRKISHAGRRARDYRLMLKESKELGDSDCSSGIAEPLNEVYRIFCSQLISHQCAQVIENT